MQKNQHRIVPANIILTTNKAVLGFVKTPSPMTPESAKEKQRLALWHCDQAIKRLAELKHIIASATPTEQPKETTEAEEIDPNQLSIPEFE